MKTNLPILKNIENMPSIIDCDKQTPRSPVDETESLAREAYGGRIYNRQILLHILR